MSKYDEIIGLPHHESQTRQRMPMYSRAAQFAPFAALSGHDEAIDETARLTTAKVELSADEHRQLSQQLALVMRQDCEARVTYFVADTRKSGGEYHSITGRIKKLDTSENTLHFMTGQAIALDDILSIDAVAITKF